MFPLIDKFNKNKIPYKTLFPGQHKDLFEQFKNYLPNLILLWILCRKTNH